MKRGINYNGPWEILSNVLAGLSFYILAVFSSVRIFIDKRFHA
jgi:hypothetical protein